MGTGYVRQSVAEIQPGVEVAAGPLNAEYNQLQAAFATNTGHNHDGSAGNGARIVISDTTGTLPINRGGTNATVGGGQALVNIAAFDTVTGGIFQIGNTNFTKRTITAGSSGNITVTNGNGVSGNPTIDLVDGPSLEGGEWTGGTLEDVDIIYYGQPIQTITANSATCNIDISQGEVVVVNQSASITTFNFNNAKTSGTATNLTVIRVKDNNATPRPITWPASVMWNKGVEPELSTTANAIDIWTFLSTNGGTTWYGFIGGTNFS